jgi:uncharacterized membrane protein
MSGPTIYLLRVLHIVLGVCWVGAVVFIAAFLVPSIRASGPAGATIMRQLMQERRMPIWLMGAAVLTILSGLGLYWVDSAGFQSTWLGSGPGRVFGIGAVMGIAAAGVGMSVNNPAGRRLAELAGPIQADRRAPTPEEAAQMAALQSRLNRATNVVAVLLLLATLAMAVARYVP